MMNKMIINLYHWEMLLICNKCSKKADIIEHEIYWCADCMIKKIGIWKIYGKKKSSKSNKEAQKS